MLLITQNSVYPTTQKQEDLSSSEDIDGVTAERMMSLKQHQKIQKPNRPVLLAQYIFEFPNFI